MVSETVRKLAALHEAARAMNSILDPDQLLEKILTLVQEVFALHSCAILLYDEQEDALTIKAARGYRPEVVENFRARPGQGVTGVAFQRGEALLVPDVSKWPGYVEGVAGARSEMAAPLRIEGQVIGVLDAESTQPNAFEEADLDLFRIFANQAATALRNANLLNQLERRSAELERRVNELALLQKLGRQLAENLDIDSLLGQVLELAHKALHFDHCAILLAERDDEGELVLRVKAALGYRDDVASGIVIRPGQGITGRVLESGKPVLIPDVSKNGSYIEGVKGGRCEMAVPMMVRGEIIGVLDAESTRPHAFDEDALRLFSTFASWAAAAIHNADMFSRLERQQKKLQQKIQQIDSMNIELQRHAERIETTNRKLEQRVKELSLLQQASQVITSSLELKKTLEAVAAMSKEILRSSHCAIRLIDEEFKRIWSIDEQALEQASSPAGAESLSVPLKVGDRVLGYFEVYSDREDSLGDNQRRVMEVLASQAAIAIENARLFETTQQTYYEAIRSLAQALEARDAYTRGHSERVTNYALATARRMGLPERSLRIIRYAGLLHDIGKIGIADSILNKRLELTEKEWSAIRNHPLFGDAILEPLKFLQDAQQIVLHHHERWDGSGYPKGLKGTQIPLEARIVAVADAFDAMTSHRPYRRAMPKEKAIEELRVSAGKQFDPEVVEAFLDTISTPSSTRNEPQGDLADVTA